MEFLFFDAANTPLFSRNDAESAEWTVEEMSLRLLLPYDEGKMVTNGMRVGFTDADGVFQTFEARTILNREPDHYQEITAEHIVIGELTDEHTPGVELADVSAGAALGQMLTGTLWSVGNDTSSGLSSASIGMGSVWQAVRTIEANWNVWITPRVTVGPSGITGRYLDISPAEGVFRGLRLALEKNVSEAGVTIDDADVSTAMFGYGRGVDGTPITFEDVVWAAEDGHPAKPAGQKYLENPAATAAYGRNGRARFGYYQNGDITDPSVLLQKTWESLQTVMEPRVEIDMTVTDLKRLGYADVPIRLHDVAEVDIQPEGYTVRRTVTRLMVDLLDPTQTRPTIGAYIKNIIYINRETMSRASGGGSGRGSGKGTGQTGSQYEISEFETEIKANKYQISLRAYQRDMANVENILKEAGVAIDASGVVIYAGNNLDDIKSSITVEADKITQIVSAIGEDGEVTAASIVMAVNDSGSSVVISADHVDLRGYVTASELSVTNAEITNLMSGATTASILRATTMFVSQFEISGQNYDFRVGGNQVRWMSREVVTAVSITFPAITRSAERRFLYASEGIVPQAGETGRIITGFAQGSRDITTDTIYYLGRS